MAETAIEHLRNVQANVRFISFEPLLGPIRNVQLDVLQGLIIGAQTNPARLPDRLWVEEIITAADKVGIPVFLKLNLNSEYLPDNAFDKDGLVRHELPKLHGYRAARGVAPRSPDAPRAEEAIRRGRGI